MPKEFRGSYTVTITPFTEDGKKIDLAAWRRFVDWQIKLGVPGIIILGTTGEFLTVSTSRGACMSWSGP
jgi:4-hydroxy-tetrahydrodipicolinate synthase